VKWWDTSTRQSRTAQVPAVTFEAAAATRLQSGIFDQRRPETTGPESAALLHALAVVADVLIAAVVAAVYLLRPTFIRARQQWQGRRQAQQRAMWQQSPDYAWQQINAQLQARPAQLSALYLWLRRSRLGLKLVNAGPRLQGTVTRAVTVVSQVPSKHSFNCANP
jgi:hypothetical protein